jgi:hypothetical protein
MYHYNPWGYTSYADLRPAHTRGQRPNPLRNLRGEKPFAAQVGQVRAHDTKPNRANARSQGSR